MNQDKRLLAFVEIDGCGADGLSVATGCWIGRRTLRVVDMGKVAATLVDTWSKRAIRVAPSHEARTLACELASQAQSRWHAYLESYQVIPDDQLMTYGEVELLSDIQDILSTPEVIARCTSCGEEIFNAREVRIGARVLCRSCSGETYYKAR